MPPDMNSFDASHQHLTGGNDMNGEPSRCGIGGYFNLFGESQGLIEPRLTDDPTKVTCPDCRQIHLATPPAAQ